MPPEVAEANSQFVDGKKRFVEISFMGCDIVVRVASFQDEIMIRLLAFAKEHALVSRLVKPYPWEEHFAKTAVPVDLDEKIIADTKKVTGLKSTTTKTYKLPVCFPPPPPPPPSSSFCACPTGSGYVREHVCRQAAADRRDHR